MNRYADGRGIRFLGRNGIGLQGVAQHTPVTIINLAIGQQLSRRFILFDHCGRRGLAPGPVRIGD